jgi:putative NIF3 family GTP cyclohydrolase 1 type 2
MVSRSEAKGASMKLIRPSCLALIVIAVLPLTTFAQTLTAADAIHRFQQHYSVPVPPNTVDTIKAGDPSTPVTGIAVTFLDTMDVLREANRRGLNLVITHEPTFYNHLDDAAFFADDPVYLEKLAFIQQHHMVVFRFHDQMHSISPDPVATGLVEALGWQSYRNAGGPWHLTIPRTTLLELSRELAKKLNAQSLRVVGDPALPITHVGLLPGAAGTQKQILALRSDEVEVLLVGEVPEWETVEYIRDASAQGRHKALILLGHEVSEEPGMKACAADLRALFPNLPVALIPAGSPTWNPDHPPTAPAGTQSAR